jgi:hypothetical protein
MRTLRMIPLLLLALPLAAQEEEPATPPEAPRDDIEIEIRAFEERREVLERVAEIRQQVKDLLEGTEAARKEAMEALKQVDIEELLKAIEEVRAAAESAGQSLALAMGPVAQLGAQVLYLDPTTGGSEVIRGSAEGIEYTLKSLGEGRYALRIVTKRNAEGNVSEVKEDEGTLKELQERHAFLKGAFAVTLPVAPTRLRGRLAYGDSTVATFYGAPEGNKVGLLVATPPEELRFHLELPEGAGLLVQQVLPGSRAEELGIRRMDILLRLDGELIDARAQLKRLHAKKGTLEILRRAETKTIDLAAAEEPAPARRPPEAPAGAR